MANNPNDKKLDCSSFEERIHQLLDDRLILTGDEMLMEHAAHCASCEELLNEYDSVDDSIKLLKTEIELIIGAQTTPTASKATISKLGWFTSTAATLLLLVGMFQSETSQPKTARTTIASHSRNFGMAAKKFNHGRSHATRAAQPIKRQQAPESSPFSPRFSLVSQIPRVPEVPTWESVSNHFNQIEPVLNLSVELPGVRTATSSLSVTIDLLKQSFSKSDSENPDLGWYLRLGHVMA